MREREIKNIHKKTKAVYYLNAWEFLMLFEVKVWPESSQAQQRLETCVSGVFIRFSNHYDLLHRITVYAEPIHQELIGGEMFVNVLTAK